MEAQNKTQVSCPTAGTHETESRVCQWGNMAKALGAPKKAQLSTQEMQLWAPAQGPRETSRKDESCFQKNRTVGCKG